MSTNRLFAQLAPSLGSCPCCEAERRSQLWEASAEQIETAINGGPFVLDDDKLVEAIYPGVATFLNDDIARIRLEFWPMQAMQIETITTLDGAREHVASELQRIARLCKKAASRLEVEGGAA